MAAITSHLALRNKLSRAHLLAAFVAAVEAGAVFFLAQHSMWPLAVLVVLAVELWPSRGKAVMERMPALLVGVSVALIIAAAPRLVTQVAAAGLFGVWRLWWNNERSAGQAGLVNLLAVQAVVFEALFLMAAVWRTPNWLILGLVWAGAYFSVYSVLSRRGERAAAVMAAAWALIAAQVSWVLLLWLFTYTMSGGYVLVPQPALILTALAYCFGSIYVSQRQGSLSRGRLTEYLLIGLILIAIVITGTPWRGSI